MKVRVILCHELKEIADLIITPAFQYCKRVDRTITILVALTLQLNMITKQLCLETFKSVLKEIIILL